MSGSFIPARIWVRSLLTLAIASGGALGFWVLSLPLPFLFGPMAGSLVAAIGGVRLRSVGQISVGARSILGVAVGASITPTVLAHLPSMAASVALVPVFIVVIALTGVPYFEKVWGYDRITAYYSAMPGGLQDMVIFGTEAGANPRTLSLVHATRVLMIVTLAPAFLVNIYGAALSNPLGAPVNELPLYELLLMALAAVIGWKGGERIGLFGASILGPLILTTILSLAGMIDTRPPREAIVFAQFFIGTAIGVQFVGITLGELRRVVTAGFVYVLWLAVLAITFSQAVEHLGLGRPTEAFLAFAPGGQAEMAVLAIVAGADLGYVVAHHLTRIVIVIVGAPLLARIFSGAKPRR